MMQGTILILLTTRIEGYNLTLFEAGQTVMKLRLSPDRGPFDRCGIGIEHLHLLASDPHLATSLKGSDYHQIINHPSAEQRVCVSWGTAGVACPLERSKMEQQPASIHIKSVQVELLLLLQIQSVGFMFR